MTYNPLSKRFALSDDTSVNYLVACRRDVDPFMSQPIIAPRAAR